MTTYKSIQNREWIRTLQQAMNLEVENDFNNILGRKIRFSVFVSKTLIKESRNLSQEISKELLDISYSYDLYDELDHVKRKNLVVKSRKLLYKLSKGMETVNKIKEPSLNLNKNIKCQVEVSNNLKSNINLDSCLCDIKGIGNKFSEKLGYLGLITVKDLLFYFPRDYVDYSSLKRIKDLIEGETATIVGTIKRVNCFNSPKNPKLSILEIYLYDATGRIKITKFLVGKRFSNYSFLSSQSKKYPKGSIIAVSGLVKESKYGKSFNEPIIEILSNINSPVRSQSIGRLLPVYSLTEGLTSDRFRSFVDKILFLIEFIREPISRKRLSLLSLQSKKEALMNIHKPTDKKNLLQAKRRLVFDEFFILQLCLLSRRIELKEKTSVDLVSDLNHSKLVNNFINSLPFDLTRSQTRVLAEIKEDLMRSEPMSRLIQGDVGSGKTVIAIAALLTVVDNGCQGALMAPTEVLANQHYVNLCRYLHPLNITVDLLTGSTSKAIRKKLLNDLANGTLNILVGTHSIFQKGVDFCRLGLAIIDEQHRFGVNQRNLFIGKGIQPHLLTMTATPIPRTLALSIHGDLDVSQIDELPPGRKPIITKVIKAKDRSIAYKIIREKITIGQKAYYVLPLIEESENLDLQSAINTYDLLSNDIFVDLNVSLLHGRLPHLEKKAIINDFHKGQTQILVSTTVIEVGIDVPEASVMVIDNAERFGLSQLHQLRGRVGRGANKSICILINGSNNELSSRRLDVLEKSNDGFEISEIDLRLRGPGQVLGTRQSGIPDFALSSLVDDRDIIELARSEAKYILDIDPRLDSHPILKQEIASHYNKYNTNVVLN